MKDTETLSDGDIEETQHKMLGIEMSEAAIAEGNTANRAVIASKNLNTG